jgi:hypothetical protein
MIGPLGASGNPGSAARSESRVSVGQRISGSRSAPPGCRLQAAGSGLQLWGRRSACHAPTRICILELARKTSLQSTKSKESMLLAASCTSCAEKATTVYVAVHVKRCPGEIRQLIQRSDGLTVERSRRSRPRSRTRTPSCRTPCNYLNSSQECLAGRYGRPEAA